MDALLVVVNSVPLLYGMHVATYVCSSGYAEDRSLSRSRFSPCEPYRRYKMQLIWSMQSASGSSGAFVRILSLLISHPRVFLHCAYCFPVVHLNYSLTTANA